MTDHAQEAAEIFGRWQRNPGITSGTGVVIAAGQLAALLAIEEQLKKLAEIAGPTRRTAP